MRKNGKRILAMLLAAVMTASLAGCGKGGETAAGTAENDNGGQEAAGQDEVVTLKMFIRNQSKYTGLQEDPVAKYIEEKLGIRIELTVDSSLGNTTAQTSTFNELLATKLASNDLDDIMDFGSPSGNPEILNNLNRAVEAGMIIPLDDLVAEYTENLSTDPRLTIGTITAGSICTMTESSTVWAAGEAWAWISFRVRLTGCAGIYIKKWDTRMWKPMRTIWRC